MTIGLLVCVPMPIVPQPLSPASWQRLEGTDVLLRCWWAPAFGTIQLRERAVLVLPEVFGVNAWVRGVAERLAAAGVSALAMPLFARTAPELELAYDPASLAEGRHHKEQATAESILADVATAAAWLQGRGCQRLTVVKFRRHKHFYTFIV